MLRHRQNLKLDVDVVWLYLVLTGKFETCIIVGVRDAHTRTFVLAPYSRTELRILARSTIFTSTEYEEYEISYEHPWSRLSILNL